MNIRPLYDRVVVRRKEEEETRLAASSCQALLKKSQIRVK